MSDFGSYLSVNHEVYLMQEYRDALASSKATGREDDATVQCVTQGSRRNTNEVQHRDPLEPTTQGSLLLQSTLRLQQPHNDIVLERCIICWVFGNDRFCLRFCLVCILCFRLNF